VIKRKFGALGLAMVVGLWGAAYGQAETGDQEPETVTNYTADTEFNQRDTFVPGIWMTEDHFDEITIVVSPDSPQGEQAAAQLFQEKWNEVTGFEPPVQATRGNAYNVWIGALGVPMPMLQKMALTRMTINPDDDIAMRGSIRLAGLGNHGFAVQTVGESLVIAGGGREGTLNGVKWFFAAHADALQGLSSTLRKPYVPLIEHREIPAQVAWWYVAQIMIGLAILFAVKWAVNYYFKGEPPVSLSVILTLLAVGSVVWFFAVFMQLLSAIWGPVTQPMAPILTFAVCFWPIRAYLSMVSAGLAKRSAHFVYLEPEQAPAFDDSQYVPPNVFKVTEDINDRVREYRSIFASQPSFPRPLFEAAQLLETHDYFDEAAEVYREIIQIFYREAHVWAEANFRLASLHENHLFNSQGAVDILKRIIDRAPETEYGKLARARLEEHSAGGHGTSGEAQQSGA